MKTIAKAILATFETGLVNTNSMESVLYAAYQANQIKWSEVIEIAKKMELNEFLKVVAAVLAVTVTDDT